MRFSSRISAMALAVLSGASLYAAPAKAEQWYFYVENRTGSNLTGLFASEDGQSWGQFDIGSGIGAGQRVKMIWSKSTNNQSCHQFLKGTFSDGSAIKSGKIDFCNDLDDPLVFSE